MKKEVLIGWAGLGMLQFNSIPAIFQAVESGQSAPISTIMLTLAGLACYLYNSIKTGNTLYTAGNIIGIIGNSILLAVVLF